MNLNRRFFLAGALSLVTAPALSQVPFIPTLDGDGIHDDADALNALFAGRNIRCENELFFAMSENEIRLIGGIYRISRPVHFRKSPFRIKIRKSHFVSDRGNLDCLIVDVDVTHVTIESCIMEWS